MLLLLLSESFLLLFLGWEGLGVTSFLLIVFYQNWMSAKGGLLTLLTNRVGDALLIITLCMWWASSFVSMTAGSGMLMMMCLLGVTFTKSAQWPYTNWLPAAMAAPTPVSALVHSSTLVTAGIWLLLRFKQLLWMVSAVWITFGLVTLTLASLAAFLESDAKKIVALSTLSQLGLMVFSLSAGNTLLAFFHMATHALAKANLFLVVGNFLHSGLSQQDARKLSLGGLHKGLLMGLSVSVASLSGALFLSGFFSKEQIMAQTYISVTSSGTLMVMILLSSLTLAYCLKLVFSLTSLSNFSFSTLSGFSLSLLPVLSLSFLSVISGAFVFGNLDTEALKISSLSGALWALLGFTGASLVMLTLVPLLSGFNINSRAIDLMNSGLMSAKSMSSLLEANALEASYLIWAEGLNKVLEASARVTLLVVLASLFLYVTYYHFI